jgi:phosphoribosylformylglycinamidine cyclo-ligase
MIQEQSNTDWKEMYQVFNMGHRMELYVPKEIASDIIEISKQYRVDAKIIGYVEEAATKKLTIKTQFGIYNYY